MLLDPSAEVPGDLDQAFLIEELQVALALLDDLLLVVLTSAAHVPDVLDPSA